MPCLLIFIRRCINAAGDDKQRQTKTVLIKKYQGL